MSKIYRSKRWKRKRAQILKRDGYLCQLSKRYGKNVEANTVHHIFPVEHFPELKYLNWNLISLCPEEHDRLHSRDDHNLTVDGKRLQRKFYPKYLNWCEKHGVKPKEI